MGAHAQARQAVAPASHVRHAVASRTTNVVLTFDSIVLEVTERRYR